MYGGFMAGLKAASTAPTWPDINGRFIPAGINELSPWTQNLINNKLAIHFIHRGLAYLLLFAVVLFFIKSSKHSGNLIFKNLRISLLLLISLQVLLGIFTVLNATNPNNFVWLAVSHQFVAMLLVIFIVALSFLVRKSKPLLY
jgi:cytochrome c oxidase assembly protein subunit 15